MRMANFGRCSPLKCSKLCKQQIYKIMPLQHGAADLSTGDIANARLHNGLTRHGGDK